jgi:hypothetical protein
MGGIGMKKKGYTAEQIIGKLREAEVLLSQGNTVGEASRRLGNTRQIYNGFTYGSSAKGCLRIVYYRSSWAWRMVYLASKALTPAS